MLEWWNSVLEIPGATRIIYPSLLLVLVLVAYYVLQLFRNLAFGGGESTANHLDTFRKMRDDGMIGTDEYKKVAGLIPMPEVDAAGKETDSLTTETGAEALTQAARDVLSQRQGEEKSAEESKEAESEQSAES